LPAINSPYTSKQVDLRNGAFLHVPHSPKIILFVDTDSWCHNMTNVMWNDETDIFVLRILKIALAQY